MRMEMRHSFETASHLEQKNELLLCLQQEIGLRIGKLEKQIVEKVNFIDIDFANENTQYHIDMLRELIVKESEKKEIAYRSDSFQTRSYY